MLKQSARVNLKHVGGGRQSGDFESNARRNKSEFLRAENCFIRDNLDILKYLFVSAEVMGQSLFIQVDIEACTDITQKSREPIQDWLISYLLPILVDDFKAGPIVWPQCRIHKFMLNLIGSRVHKFPMLKIGHHQLVEKL